MSTIQEVTPQQFEAEVLSSTTPVLVDFYGHHCPACVRMLPVVEEVAGERAGSVRVLKMNAHDHFEFVSQFRIAAVPNFILFSKGAPVGLRAGSVSKSALLNWLDESIR